jgi:hypothetical protein
MDDVTQNDIKKDGTTRFKDRWSGIQSIVSILVIFVGACWAVTTFWGFGQAEKLKNDNTVQGVVNLTIEASQVMPPDAWQDEARYIKIELAVKNVGTKNVLMCYEDPVEGKTSNCEAPPAGQIHKPCTAQRPCIAPINVARAHYDPSRSENENKIKFDLPIRATWARNDDPSTPESALYVRAGQTISRIAVVAVPHPGLYRVSFSARLPKNETSLPQSLKPIWGTSQFVIVK